MHTDHTQSWQIQINFNRQRLTVKVINDIERAKTTATDQSIMHKVDRPALVQASGVASGEVQVPGGGPTKKQPASRRVFAFRRYDRGIREMHCISTPVISSKCKKIEA
jgi:hypothetical protein